MGHPLVMPVNGSPIKTLNTGSGGFPSAALPLACLNQMVQGPGCVSGEQMFCDSGRQTHLA